MFDAIGFDQVMNRALYDTLRLIHDSYLNNVDVNAVVRVTNDAVQVMHSSDLNLQTGIQDSAANQNDLFRGKRVVQRW